MSAPTTARWTARSHTWLRALGPDALDDPSAAGPFAELRALLPAGAP